MKKTVCTLFLLILLFLPACDAHNAALDAQQAPEPKAADAASPVDVFGLPEGQC